MNSKQVNCSVLMCVYSGDKVSYFREAMDSMLNQTMRADEIVVVVDGPVGKDMMRFLDEVRKKDGSVKIVKLPKNVGVGMASNEGLKYCKNELVAKMDADDIAVPERLELQVKAFAKDSKLALLGGQLAEFSESRDKVVSVRRVPTAAKEIKKFARRRSPFNNQTVMYKKSAVLAVGGYPELNRSEDYYLFSKMMAEGYRVKNMAEVLVYFRLDKDAIGRRRTWRHTKEIIRARNEIRKLGISNWLDFVIAAVGQMLVFVLPAFFARWLYRRLRK